MNQDWVNDWYSVGVVTDVAPGNVIRKRIGEFDLAPFNLDGDFFDRADACGRCGQPLSDGQILQAEVECRSCGLRVQITQAENSSAPVLFPVMIVDDEIFAWIEKYSESSPA